jgi:hypothetical protein
MLATEAQATHLALLELAVLLIVVAVVAVLVVFLVSAAQPQAMAAQVK